MKIVGKFFASKQQISLGIVKFFFVNSIFKEDDAAASPVMDDDDIRRFLALTSFKE